MQPAELAKTARVKLAAALNALQSDEVPEQLAVVAEPIAQAMGILHRIERTQGANLDGRDDALNCVRTALDTLQGTDVFHPAVEVVMESIAASLSKVHQLSKFSPSKVPPAAGGVPRPSPSNSGAPRPAPAAPAPAAPAPAAPAPAPAAPAPAPAPAQPAPAPVAAAAASAAAAPSGAGPNQTVMIPGDEAKTLAKPAAAAGGVGGGTAVMRAQATPAPQPAAPAATPAPQAHAAPQAHPAPSPQAAFQAAPSPQASPQAGFAPAPAPGVQAPGGAFAGGAFAGAAAAPSPQAQPAHAAPPAQAAHAAQAHAQPAHAAPQAQPAHAQAQAQPHAAAAGYPAAPGAYPAAPGPTAAAPPPQAYQAPQPTAPAAPAPAGTAGAVAGGNVVVELGAHSGSNFYKGLGGNDVIEHGGIFVATYKIPQIGTNVALRVLLPGDYEFHAQAVVQWSREASSEFAEPGFGARFTQISPEGRQLVYRYTRNREPIFYDDL